MKQYIFILILFMCSFVVLIISFHQDKPGKHNWFHSLAGDWTIEVKNGYEIGPSTVLGQEGFYHVIKWVSVKMQDGKIAYAPKSIADTISAYNIIEDNNILLKTPGNWIILNTSTGEQLIYTENDFPEKLLVYKQNMKLPKPSERDRLLVLFFILAGSLIFLTIKKFIGRLKTIDKQWGKTRKTMDSGAVEKGP